MELCSMACEWEGSLGENGYVYMYGRVPSPETIMTLLISYTPIQKKSFLKNLLKKKEKIYRSLHSSPFYPKFWLFRSFPQLLYFAYTP